MKTRKDYNTNIKDIIVHVTTKIENKKARIAAYGKSQETGNSVTKTYRRNSSSKDIEVELATAHLINHVLEKYQEGLSNQTKSKSVINSTNQNYYREKFEEAVNGNKISLPNEWRTENTRKSTVTYFKNKVLPLMDANYNYLDQSCMSNIFSQLLDGVKSNGHYKRIEDNAKKNLSDKLKRINILLTEFSIFLKNEYNDNTLIDIQFDIPRIKIAKKTEQIKALSDKVRKAIVAFAYKNSNEFFVLGMMAMLTAGLRTAEAAALTYEDIEVDEVNNFAVCLIRKQIINGMVTDVLKTQNAYRNVVSPKVFVDLYTLKKKQLKKAYKDDDIKKMFLSPSPKDINSPCKAEEMSTKIKEVIIQCGVREEEMCSATVLMGEEKDMDAEGRQNNDATAYLT